MSITITYPESGRSRILRNLTQAQINKLVSNISDMQENNYVHCRIIVADDAAVCTRVH